MSNSQPMLQHYVIVGGGAGGLILAARLGRLAKKHPNRLQITLIDQSPTHIWKPLLHEIAAGTLNSFEDEISYFPHSLKNGYEFLHGHVNHVDTSNHLLTLDPIKDDQGNTIRNVIKVPFDILVIAAGSVSNDFAILGVKEYCYLLDSRAEAERLHVHLTAHLMSLKFDVSVSKDDPFTISIVGGGATGVELAAELMSAVDYLSQLHGMTDIHEKVRVRIIEAGDTLLPGQHAGSIQVAKDSMRQLNIEVLTQSKVSRVQQQSISMTDGQQLTSDIHVWTTGIKAPDFIRAIEALSMNKIGQITVDAYLRTLSCPEIYVIGDCADLTIEGKQLGPRAQVAQQQALYLYGVFKKQLSDAPVSAFVFRERGSVFSLGEKVAVGTLQLRGKTPLRIKGYVARLTYNFLYRKHQIEILGWYQGLIVIIKDLISRVTGPKVKLH